MGETLTRSGIVKTTPGTRYEDDLYTWANEQVALLREGRVGEVDSENVAEELSDVAKGLYWQLWTGLRVLVMNMLKWDQQPEFRTATWSWSIEEQRRRYAKLMSKSPGLILQRDEALADAYESARDWAALETHLHVSEFPEECPYTWVDVLDRPFEV